MVLRPAVGAGASAGRCPRRDENKEPWFVLKDVCDVLELQTYHAKDRLVGDDLGTTEVIDRLGRSQQVTTVNESGLYDVIFQSRTAGR